MSDLDLSNVRKKSRLFDLLPWLNENTATAVYPYIYVPRAIYEDLHKQDPNPYYVALILHEREHIKRAKIHGVFRFYTKYLLRRQFRFVEELEATKPQFSHLKKSKLDPNIERRAQYLSGWLYLWPVSYDTALRKLQEIWDKR